MCLLNVNWVVRKKHLNLAMSLLSVLCGLCDMKKLVECGYAFSCMGTQYGRRVLPAQRVGAPLLAFP